MKIVVVYPCLAGGAPRSAGEVVDVSEGEALNALATGRVKIAPADQPPQASASTSLPVETTIDNRESGMPRRRRR